MTTAAVLCGGKGTRLAPVIGDLPKCLAPVRDPTLPPTESLREPFLYYIARHLKYQGIGRMVFCTGYGAEEVEEAMDIRWPNVKFSREDEPLGTAGALRLARDRGLLDTDPVVVVNGDTWCPFQLAPLLKWHQAKKAGITLLCGAPVYSDRWIRGGMVHAGVSLASREYLESIPTLPKKLDRWHWFLEYCCVDVPFLDIGTPEGYAVAEDVIRG